MKRRILITVYNMEIGGIEQSLINMLERFDYRRFDVDLLVYHHTGDLLSLIPEQARLLPELRPYTIFRKPIAQCLREGLFGAVFIRLLSKLQANCYAWFHKLKEGSGYVQMQLTMKYGCRLIPEIKTHYDLAISYAWPHDIVAERVHADCKVAWIHTDYRELDVNRRQDLKVWQRFDHIFAVSEQCKHTFLSVYPSLSSCVTVMENIQSPERVRSLATQYKPNWRGATNESFCIVSVGRLSYVKGFDMAIRALRRLHDKGYTNVKWYVIGYGGFEQELKEVIADCKLQESFFLLGKKTNPYPYMKMCDLYVQPSRYEGKAVTVTEAQILARPVLITDYPTAKSQVTPSEDGMICSCSVEGLAEAIERLYHDEALRRRLTEQLQRRVFGNVEELNKLYTLTEPVADEGGVAI